MNRAFRAILIPVIDFKKDLNSSQYAAVTAKGGPMLVLAGAGSGKTRVIEYRALFLVREGVRPESILLLTFTRKAAREMLSRAAKRDERCEMIRGGTFHSFAYKTLKRYSKLIGFDGSFSVLDESDAADAVGRSAESIGIVDRGKRFPKKDTIKGIISSSINKDLNIEEVLEAQYPDLLEFCGEIEAIRDEYERFKRKRGYMDYDDLLVNLKLVLDDPRARERISKEYEYVMVDEYQDTNPLQGEITHLLAKERRNIMVVGDDAQSIYGFRGSSHKNIMDFPKMFPECKMVTLEENYRSTQSILDVANAILENMEDKYSKVLVSGLKEEGEKPKFRRYKDQYDEASGIARSIDSFRERGIDLDEQGVLFRSAFHSIALQMELEKRGIPYRVVGGRKFYETAHVKDFISHLKIIANFKDDLAWDRSLTVLAGIGAKTSERIIDTITPVSGLDEAITRLGDGQPKAVRGLASLLKEASREELEVIDRLDLVLDYYFPLLKDNYDDWNVRINDLETIKEIGGQYSSLEDFLADFAIDRPEKGTADAPSLRDRSAVTLTTIHSAKGLEWDAVFLMNVAEGALPISFSLNSDEELEEEQRLFYVAVTRARKKLIISYPFESKRGYERYINQPSRFVEAPNVMSMMDTTVSRLGFDDLEIIEE